MKANNRDDDLFKESTMTFGEHLEELRVCLFKAVLALAVGFVIGLSIGKWVVHRVQDPLEVALTKLYMKRSADRFMKDIERREKLGFHVPAEFKDPERVKEWILREGLIFEEYYVSAEQIFEELKKEYPQQFAGLKELRKPTGDAEEKKAEKDKDQGKDENQNAIGLSRSKMLHLFLARPAEDDERLRAEALGVEEPFMMYIKASLIAGIVIASPFIFYFLWSFVASGLYPNEKRYVHVFLPFSIGLFLCGAMMAYFFVFPPVLNFFFDFSESLGQEQRPRITEWLNFVLMLPLAFGISFQLPLVMLFMERIGIFTAQTYLKKWRIAILVMAIASMVLSPGGDPWSMLLMLGPMIFLYFGGIALCVWLPSRRSGLPEPAPQG